MKNYNAASLTSGCIGIWWVYDGDVIGLAIPLDSGYDDGRYIHYDQFKNHSTEWKTTLQEQLPEKYEELYPRLYKSIERGRVVYNIRTQTYEIICNEAMSYDVETIKQIIKFYDLENCRYDIYADPHYHIYCLIGNPTLDDFEYGF